MRPGEKAEGIEAEEGEGVGGKTDEERWFGS